MKVLAKNCLLLRCHRCLLSRSRLREIRKMCPSNKFTFRSAYRSLSSEWWTEHETISRINFPVSRKMSTMVNWKDVNDDHDHGPRRPSRRKNETDKLWLIDSDAHCVSWHFSILNFNIEFKGKMWAKRNTTARARGSGLCIDTRNRFVV